MTQNWFPADFVRLLHIPGFEAAQFFQQSDGAVVRDGKSGKAGLSHRDVQRRETLFGFCIQFGATLDEELYDRIGAPGGSSVQGGLASGIDLVYIQTRLEAHLQRLQGFALSSAGILVPIADAGSKHQRRVSFLGGELGVGSFFQKKAYRHGVSGSGGPHQRG